MSSEVANGAPEEEDRGELRLAGSTCMDVKAALTLWKSFMFNLPGIWNKDLIVKHVLGLTRI
jgi:hypothetical protein